MIENNNQPLNCSIKSAQVILPCRDLTESLDFFVEKLGFRLEMIFPADAPSTAVVSGYGITLRLETKDETVPVTLHLLCDSNSLPSEIISPDGVLIKFVEANPTVNLPVGKQEFVLSRMDENIWVVGRAGMQYRDLIPGRLGGQVIASHIRLPKGGEVPDYVHFHKVIFQMIYCKTGWAKLVYEDQGEPFIFKTGDCVLQPPEIRHRVLECSDGFEVIEIGCPAIHETFADHNLQLPTAQFLPEKIFNGQKFVHHIAEKNEWKQSGFEDFAERDTGISEATNGLAEVRVLRTNSEGTISHKQTGEFLFYFVLDGEMKLNSDDFGKYQLKIGDSCVIPANAQYVLEANTGLEMLEVFLPN